MDVFVHVLITLISIYILYWICGVIYLIHPFKFLTWFYNNVRRLCKIAKGTGSHLINILRRKTC